MNRRDFLRSTAIFSTRLAFPETTRLFAEGTLPGVRHMFEVTTQVEVLKPSGTTRIWLPLPLISATPFQRTLDNKFRAEGGAAKLIESKTDALGMVIAEFPAGVKPALTLKSRVATRDIAVDLSAPRKPPKTNRVELDHYLRPTMLLPADGIVKDTAVEITKGSATDVQKARAIFVVHRVSIDMYLGIRLIRSSLAETSVVTSREPSRSFHFDLISGRHSKVSGWEAKHDTAIDAALHLLLTSTLSLSLIWFGIWKIVAFIFARPGMKTLEVLFQDDFQCHAFRDRLDMLYPNLVCACQDPSQVRRERDSDPSFGIRSTNFRTLRGYFHPIVEYLGRSKPKLHQVLQPCSGH